MIKNGGPWDLNNQIFGEPWNPDVKNAIYSLSGNNLGNPTGLLPGNPLFLFVGQVREPAMGGSGGSLTWKLQAPWGSPGNTLTVTLPSASPDTQSTLDRWRLDPQGQGWLWLLAEAPPLDGAITSCRNAKAGIAGGECTTQASLLAGTTPLAVTAQVVLGIDTDGSLMSIAARPPAPIRNRWIYADLSRYGTQAVLPPDVDEVVVQQGGGLGLLRVEWQPDSLQLSPNLVLHREPDGLYRLLWKNF
jgi:hypothetical protein